MLYVLGLALDSAPIANRFAAILIPANLFIMLSVSVLSSLRQVYRAIFIISLQDLADNRKDKEREYRAPDEGVDDHQHPPNETAGGGAKGVGDDVARLAKEALEDQETYEMHHAQRHIGKQE